MMDVRRTIGNETFLPILTVVFRSAFKRPDIEVYMMLELASRVARR